MVYFKIKLTKIHFRTVTFFTLTRIFRSFSPSVGGSKIYLTPPLALKGYDKRTVELGFMNERFHDMSVTGPSHRPIYKFHLQTDIYLTGNSKDCILLQ